MTQIMSSYLRLLLLETVVAVNRKYCKGFVETLLILPQKQRLELNSYLRLSKLMKVTQESDFKCGTLQGLKNTEL